MLETLSKQREHQRTRERGRDETRDGESSKDEERMEERWTEREKTEKERNAIYRSLLSTVKVGNPEEAICAADTTICIKNELKRPSTSRAATFGRVFVASSQHFSSDVLCLSLEADFRH